MWSNMWSHSIKESVNWQIKCWDRDSLSTFWSHILELLAVTDRWQYSNRGTHNNNDTLARLASLRHSMMAEDPGGTFFNFSLIFPSFSLPPLAIETWQDPQAR